LEDLTINIIFFAELLLAVIIIGVFTWHLYYLKQFQILSKKYLKIIKKRDLPIFYSTFGIKKEALKKFFHLRPHKETVFYRMALKNPKQTLKILEYHIKKHPKNLHLLLLLAELNHLLFNRAHFVHIVESVHLPRFLPQHLKAQYLRLSALNNLYQTDMLTSSTQISKALKMYQKLGYTYEEGQCYLIIAQIYRISGVHDVAFTMLKEAKKIFKQLNIQAKIAEVEAYIGLTEIGRENFTPASEYLESAAKICLKNNLQNTLADIKNWQGLAAFLTKKTKTAEKFFNQTLEMTKNRPTLCFATEMLARIALKNKNFDKALSFAEKALNFAKQQNHRPGIFENLYLQAEIYYLKKDYIQSRKILTQLVKEKNPPSAIYYPANAYTLLGLVEFMEENLDKARTLFKQALDLEHAQNRLKGAAFDYNNLAELSKRMGDLPEAEKYLKKALEYAKEIEDKELISYLQPKLN